MGMFKNPMFLMLGFSGIMMLVMPKMLKNLGKQLFCNGKRCLANRHVLLYFDAKDPEAMQDVTQTQADAQNMINDMPTSLSQMFAKAQQQAQQHVQQRPARR